MEVAGLEALPDLPEPAEDADSFAENARRKALYYARATGQWCLADDSGLVVDALGGEPGVKSARYAAEGGKGAKGDRGPEGAGTAPPSADRAARDAANNAKLLAALADIPDERRTARFICHLALADPQGILIEASGEVRGRIARSPRGSNGFGYDPLFILPDRGCSLAELSAAGKNAISHRGQAVRRFAALLRDMLMRNGITA